MLRCFFVVRGVRTRSHKPQTSKSTRGPKGQMLLVSALQAPPQAVRDSASD